MYVSAHPIIRKITKTPKASVVLPKGVGIKKSETKKQVSEFLRLVFVLKSIINCESPSFIMYPASTPVKKNELLE